MKNVNMVKYTCIRVDTFFTLHRRIFIPKCFRHTFHSPVRQAGSAEANYTIYVVSMVRREALDGCRCSAQNKTLCSEPPAGSSDKHLI